METLQAQLQKVTDQLAQLDPNNRDNLVEIAGLEQKKAVLIMKMEDSKAQEEQQAAQMVRIQAQEEKVESIVLPQNINFNEAFDDPRANEIIIEVVKDYQRKANAEHNAEIEGLIAQHREDLRAAADRELQLKRQNDELQALLEIEERANDENLSFIAQLKIERDDAYAKRDAAVSKAEGLELLLAEKEAHIQTLRDEAAIGASRTINVTAIEASDRLSQLVKESAAEKANRALARWADVIEVKPVVVDPPIMPAGQAVFQPGDTQTDDTTNQLDQTGFIPIPADHQEVAPITFPVQSGDAVDSGVSSTNGEGQTEARVTREEFEALKATVKELCEVCNIAEVA
jgi:hypothetical protein